MIKQLSAKISKHIKEQDYCALIIEHDVVFLKEVSEKVFEMEEGKLSKVK